MAGDSTNVIIGAATLSINGTDVGYTRGGVSVRYEEEVKDIMADQVNGIVKKARTLERMYIKTTLLETTLALIRRAFMLPAASLSGSTLTLGYNNSCWIDNVALVIVGKGPNCGTRTWTISNAVTFGTKNLEMKREEETVIEIEWEAVKNNSGNFGTLVDS